MRTFGLLVGIVAIAVCGCSSGKVEIAGNIKGLTGEVLLKAIIPESGDTIVLDSQRAEQGPWQLSTSELSLPARVWVQWRGRDEISLIVDKNEKIQLRGDICPDSSVVIEGGSLEALYLEWEKLLAERYEEPIRKYTRLLQECRSQENRGRDEEEKYRRQLKRYKHYRAEYIKKVVKINGEHELSLFILNDHLQDSVNLQKQLFENLKIQNKKSNIYKTIAYKLSKI